MRVRIFDMSRARRGQVERYSAMRFRAGYLSNLVACMPHTGEAPFRYQHVECLCKPRRTITWFFGF